MKGTGGELEAGKGVGDYQTLIPIVFTLIVPFLWASAKLLICINLK